MMHRLRTYDAGFIHAFELSLLLIMSSKNAETWCEDRKITVQYRYCATKRRMSEEVRESTRAVSLEDAAANAKTRRTSSKGR